MIGALAALEARIIEANEEKNCSSEIKIGNRVAHCWNKNGHGKSNVDKALAQSWDVFFLRSSP